MVFAKVMAEVVEEYRGKGIEKPVVASLAGDVEVEEASQYLFDHGIPAYPYTTETPVEVLAAKYRWARMAGLLDGARRRRMRQRREACSREEREPPSGTAAPVERSLDASARERQGEVTMGVGRDAPGAPRGRGTATAEGTSGSSAAGKLAADADPQAARGAARRRTSSGRR